jgi:hypothetical protein
MGVFHLRPEQRVIDPSLRFADVKVGGHHVAVARQDGRSAAVEQRLGAPREALNHRGLKSNFDQARVAVRKMEAADN